MPRLALRLNPNHPAYHPNLCFVIGAGAVSANPLYISRDPNADILGFANSHSSLVIRPQVRFLEDDVHQMLTRMGQTNILNEIADGVRKNVVICEVDGVALTPTQIIRSDFPQFRVLSADLEATNDPPADGDSGLAVQGLGSLHYQAVADDPPNSDASFIPWAYIGGAWFPLTAAQQSDGKNWLHSVSESEDRPGMITRVYIQLSAYVSGTWTLRVAASW